VDEIDKILYDLGYFDDNPLKKQQIAGYVAEAVEFMKASGVPCGLLDTQRAYAVKSLWADGRDKGEADALIGGDKMIVHLISQLRRAAHGGETAG
jgi:hypothetical protein